MRQLEQIREEINGVAPRWSNVKVNVRGLPLYADSLLKGISRFSRKTGSVGLVNPDVEVFLASQLQVNQNQLIVNRVNQWFKIGDYIAVGGLEKFQITDIAEDGVTFTLNVNVKVSQAVGTSVTLYSTPIISISNFSQGADVIQIRSLFPMLIGDIVAFETYSNFFNEIEVLHVSDLGVTNNPYPYTYELTLKIGLPYSLIAEQKFQLRAFPAYFSPIIKIPKSPSSARDIGPFLVDFYSGRINDGITPEVFHSAQFYDIFAQKVLSQQAISIGKNYAVFSKSIASDTFLFWNKMAGEMNLVDGKAVGVFDSNGNFGVTYDLQPRIASGSTWSINIRTTAITTLRVGFEPNPFQTFTLPAFANVNLIVGTTPSNSLPIEKITIAAGSSAGALLTLGNWTLIGSEVERVAVGIMARVTTEATWLSSSLIVKPYFLNLDYLSTIYDTDANYDSGHVYL